MVINGNYDDDDDSDYDEGQGDGNDDDYDYCCDSNDSDDDSKSDGEDDEDDDDDGDCRALSVTTAAWAPSVACALCAKSCEKSSWQSKTARCDHVTPLCYVVAVACATMTSGQARSYLFRFHCHNSSEVYMCV